MAKDKITLAQCMLGLSLAGTLYAGQEYDLKERSGAGQKERETWMEQEVLSTVEKSNRRKDFFYAALAKRPWRGVAERRIGQLTADFTELILDHRVPAAFIRDASNGEQASQHAVQRRLDALKNIGNDEYRQLSYEQVEHIMRVVSAHAVFPESLTYLKDNVSAANDRDAIDCFGNFPNTLMIRKNNALSGNVAGLEFYIGSHAMHIIHGHHYLLSLAARHMGGDVGAVIRVSQWIDMRAKTLACLQFPQGARGTLTYLQGLDLQILDVGIRLSIQSDMHTLTLLLQDISTAMVGVPRPLCQLVAVQGIIPQREPLAVAPLAPVVPLAPVAYRAEVAHHDPIFRERSFNGKTTLAVGVSLGLVAVFLYDKSQSSKRTTSSSSEGTAQSSRKLQCVIT